MTTAQVLVSENKDLVSLDKLYIVIGKDTGDDMDYHVLAEFVNDGQVFLVGRVGQRHADAMDETFINIADETFMVTFQMTLVHRKVGDNAAFLE